MICNPQVSSCLHFLVPCEERALGVPPAFDLLFLFHRFTTARSSLDHRVLEYTKDETIVVGTVRRASTKVMVALPPDTTIIDPMPHCIAPDASGTGVSVCEHMNKRRVVWSLHPQDRQLTQQYRSPIEKMDDAGAHESSPSTWSKYESQGRDEADLASLPDAVRAIVEEGRAQSKQTSGAAKAAAAAAANEAPYTHRLYEEAAPGEDDMLQLQWMRVDVRRRG